MAEGRDGKKVREREEGRGLKKKGWDCGRVTKWRHRIEVRKSGAKLTRKQKEEMIDSPSS